MTTNHAHENIGRTPAALSPVLDESNTRLLTVRELAHVLRMHEVSIRRLALAGSIPSLKIGRSVRFRLQAVLDAMEHRGGVDHE